MRMGVVMKDTLDYINNELVSLQYQIRFVADNIEDISMRHKCCKQLEISINKINALIKETDTNWESK